MLGIFNDSCHLGYVQGGALWYGNGTVISSHDIKSMKYKVSHDVFLDVCLVQHIGRVFYFQEFHSQ